MPIKKFTNLQKNTKTINGNDIRFFYLFISSHYEIELETCLSFS